MKYERCYVTDQQINLRASTGRVDGGNDGESRGGGVSGVGAVSGVDVRGVGEAGGVSGASVVV